jgi:hypothetical protein
MTYRDNDVYLPVGDGYTLINGTYTVESFSVTEGQDPDHHIKVGMVVSFGSNGKLTFSVGRKSSSDTANWFNGKIQASQNTFDHTADQLYFAILGTLKMTVTGGILGGGQETVTFLNVALAQGSDFVTNNWWFGGKNCTYSKDHQVNCKGTDSKGSHVTFVCRRGGSGNSVNKVNVSPKSFLDTNNWMKHLSDDLALDRIMMPGSHDAGMSTLSHCAPPLGADGYTKTQSRSIGQQLSDGSRYFDIRVDYDYNELVTYHRTDSLGCNGQSLKSVLDQTQSFLNDYPEETAILKFSHIRNYKDHHASDTKLKINNLLNSYQKVMYVNAADPNLADITMGELRGKMILVFDYSDYINSATGRFRYKDGSTTKEDTNITVYDEYSNTSSYNAMKKDQLSKWKSHAGMGTKHFFLLSWTLTASPPLGSTIETLAAEANSKLPGVLYDQIVTSKAQKPNIVYIDFVNNTVTQSIIRYNF